MRAATVHRVVLALWAAVALVSLGGCVLAPAVVRASQQPYHNRMDALEERYVQLRAERKNLVTALEGVSAEEGAPQRERLAAVNAEIREVALQLDLPVSNK
ncbi:hypothetical protein J2W30_005141 [Variovorax boronicumulans]|uniref:hypothetical protein n=1 Tax=Variovorax TaxID=34072 RepID=UPI002784CA00|nr:MULTISPECIES: hypothetical protein [Variovorax]MDQ0037365.1 hypothetical protein [Variovorax boronicumulans]MDQ0041860.1 hypothetical protein [Variovorax boronicumulans]MDQ0610214.1 hypothetical protein [Variovorax sp. W1I1]